MNASSSTFSSADGLEISSIGSLYKGIWEKKYWSSTRGKDRYPYPIGYQAMRNYAGQVYKMEIQEGPKGPLFVITSDDGVSCFGETPTIVWENIVKSRNMRAQKLHSRIDGAELFGFTNLLVQRMFRELLANEFGTAVEIHGENHRCDPNFLPDPRPSTDHGSTKKKRLKLDRRKSVYSSNTGSSQKPSSRTSLMVSRNVDNDSQTVLSVAAVAETENWVPDTFQQDEKPFCRNLMRDTNISSADNLDKNVGPKNPGSASGLDVPKTMFAKSFHDTQYISHACKNADHDTKLSAAIPFEPCEILSKEVPDCICDQLNPSTGVLSEHVPSPSQQNGINSSTQSSDGLIDKPDTDSMGQELAKSMMTLLLPQALPLLRKGSRKKRKVASNENINQTSNNSVLNGAEQNITSPSVSTEKNFENLPKIISEQQCIDRDPELKVTVPQEPNSCISFKQEGIDTPEQKDTSESYDKRRDCLRKLTLMENINDRDCLCKLTLMENINDRNNMEEEMLLSQKNVFNEIDTKKEQSALSMSIDQIGKLSEKCFFQQPNASKIEDDNNSLTAPYDSSNLDCFNRTFLVTSSVIPDSLEEDKVFDANSKGSSFSEPRKGSKMLSDPVNENTDTDFKDKDMDMLVHSPKVQIVEDNSRNCCFCDRRMAEEKGFNVTFLTNRQGVSDNQISSSDTHLSAILRGSAYCTHESKVTKAFVPIGCYEHPIPVVSLLLNVWQKYVHLCVICGHPNVKERSLFIYKVDTTEGSCYSSHLHGFADIVFPERQETKLAIDKCGIQLTPDGQTLVLLNAIKIGNLREPRAACLNSKCILGDKCEEHGVKLVSVNGGCASILARFSSVDIIYCVLVSAPQYIIAAGENGQIHVWNMDLCWRTCVEEFVLPGHWRVSSHIWELLAVPHTPDLVIGHYHNGNYAVWDISRRMLLSTFDSGDCNIMQSVIVDIFNKCQHNRINKISRLCNCSSAMGGTESVQGLGCEKSAVSREQEVLEMNESQLIPNRDNIVVCLFVLYVSHNDEINSNEKEIHADKNPCWRLAFLVNDVLLLGDCLDASLTSKATAVSSLSCNGLLGTFDGFLHAWEVMSGKQLLILQDLKGVKISCISSAATTDAFAVAGSDNRVFLYVQLSER